MPPPTNTFTVTITDAHAHSITYGPIPAASKQDALLAAAQSAQTAPDTAILVQADAWSATITQP